MGLKNCQRLKINSSHDFIAVLKNDCRASTACTSLDDTEQKKLYKKSFHLKISKYIMKKKTGFIIVDRFLSPCY